MTKHTARTFVPTVLLFAASTGNLWAAPIDPDRALPSVDEIKGAGAERLFTSVTAAGMTIKFEETTLADVKEAFGGEIQTAGDAGTSSYWLCYLTGTDAQRSILWFVADGEMGSSDHALNTIAVEPHPDSGAAEGCASAPASLTALAFDIPGVGSTLADVTVKFGPASPDSKGHFHYAGLFPDAALKDFETTQTVVYTSMGGKIVGVALSQVTTN